MCPLIDDKFYHSIVRVAVEINKRTDEEKILSM